MPRAHNGYVEWLFSTEIDIPANDNEVTHE